MWRAVELKIATARACSTLRSDELERIHPPLATLEMIARKCKSRRVSSPVLRVPGCVLTRVDAKGKTASQHATWDGQNKVWKAATRGWKRREAAGA